MTEAQIKDAIRKLFGDTSRSPRETKEALESIAELAEELAEAISS